MTKIIEAIIKDLNDRADDLFDFEQEKRDKLELDYQEYLIGKDAEMASETLEGIKDVLNDREEAESFCPMCDSASTYYTNGDDFDAICAVCGHSFEADQVSVKWIKENR